MAFIYPKDISSEANKARFDLLHPNHEIIAIGTDNSGRLPPLEGEIYDEDVLSDTEFAESVLLDD